MNETERENLQLRVERAARDRFTDPMDAARMVDLDRLAQFEPEERDGEIERAVRQLLETKPYLSVRHGQRPLVTQGGRSLPPDSRLRKRQWLRST